MALSVSGPCNSTVGTPWSILRLSKGKKRIEILVVIAFSSIDCFFLYNVEEEYCFVIKLFNFKRWSVNLKGKREIILNIVRCSEFSIVSHNEVNDPPMGFSISR